MKIVPVYPPNIDQIEAVFKVRGTKGVIFTFGDTIYAPDGGEMPPWLRAHEGVHYSRQTAPGMTPEAWWERYLVDPEFRLGEELPAHRAEYRSLCSLARDRNIRSRALHEMAQRLSGPLYGGVIKFADARRRIAE